MSLQKLNLAPNERSYTARESITAITTKLGGGASRQRRDYLNQPAYVAVEWSCDPEEYLYLQTFFRVHEYGGLAFHMDLILHTADLTTHECRFVPDKFKLVRKEGDLFIVRAELEVVPNAFDSDFDDGLVTTFESFGVEGAAAYTDLELLVNTTLPHAIDPDVNP